MIIKVCGMAEPENIKELEQLGSVDWMGMIFYPGSKRYLPAFGHAPEAYQKIDLVKIGVFVNASLDDIREKTILYGLHTIQLHGDESVAFVRQVKEMLNVKLIKVFRIGADWDWKVLLPFAPYADLFLFDTGGSAYGGTGHRFNWETLKQYTINKPFLLSGGIGMEHKEEVLKWYSEIPAMEGIDINSKFESQPGIKDIERVNKFATAIKSALSKKED